MTVRTTIPILNAGRGTARFSAGLIGFIAAFVTGRQGISEDEARAWAEDLEGQGEDYFFSINLYVFVATA